MMNLFKVLIPTAGKGSRISLNHPKSFLKINSKTIISRTLSTFYEYDRCPTVIINPKFESLFEDHFLKENLKAEIIFQNQSKGMGHAILQYEKSQYYNKFENIILAWGDIPFINKKTLSKIITHHIKNNNDFTFPTIKVKNPYTLIIRDSDNKIKKIEESRDNNISKHKGERDIGIFIFKKSIIFNALKKKLTNRFSKSTGEHGFLYIIEYLINQGRNVEGLLIASFKETLSINTIKDYEIAKLRLKL